MFYGNNGVLGLTRWIEKTKFVFEINSCIERSKVKFVVFTYANTTMSWWNGHAKTISLASANALT